MESEITTNDVVWAYKIFFNREPESNEVVELHKNQHKSLKHFILACISSEEFIKNEKTQINIKRIEKVNDIEINLTTEQLKTIFRLTQTSWHNLGDTEPFWSVLTNKCFSMEKIAETKDTFYNSGEQDVNVFLSIIGHNKVVENVSSLKNMTILEIGCGVGRMTHHFAKHFKSVFGYDISKKHIEIARHETSRTKNVDYVHLEKMSDFEILPKVNFVYSAIVLQHNPPPIIKYIIGNMLNALITGGHAVFQVPIYLQNYSFDYKKYIKHAGKGMEMHCLSQKEIFAQAYACNCVPVQTFEYNMIGGNGSSYMFVFKKM